MDLTLPKQLEMESTGKDWSKKPAHLLGLRWL